jgi:CheY-like chemotaxis protein
LPADGRLATNLDDPIEPLHPRGTETILLAEDEELVRRVVVHILERAGYRTMAVSNGTEAIRRLKENGETVHLVLLDVVMPVLGGPETWESIRGLRDGLRVLFMSGYADDRYRGQLPKDAELIEKPFRREELLRRVRRILDTEPR